MSKYSLSHVGDEHLVRGLASRVGRETLATAEVLAYLAEFDARRLYLPAAYPSMFAYCVHELRYSEDSASKRIHAARAARAYPGIFEAVEDGRLHLSAICLLAPHLTAENAAGFLAAAVHKTKREIEALIAEHFPRTELLPLVEALPASFSHTQHAPGHVRTASDLTEHAPGHVEARIEPIAARRFALHLSMDEDTRDMLSHAQELLSHELPSGDVAGVVKLALKSLIGALEKRRFAATAQPRKAPRPTTSRRHIPAAVKRAVWKRDQARCTFVSEDGKRCPSRSFLEFDHVIEVARGGQATVDGIRLRCRAHNQFTAERTFGAGFMKEKREAAPRAAAGHRVERAAEQSKEQARVPTPRALAAATRSVAIEPSTSADVIPWLRQLGIRADDAQRAAAHGAGITTASLEERVRAALAFHGAHLLTRSPAPAAGMGAAI